MDLYSQGLAKQLRAARASRRPRAERPVDPAPYTSPPQLAAITDPARERAFEAGRRAGKTRSFCWCLLLACMAAPNQSAVYLSTSINRAVDTIWEELTEVLKEAGVSYTQNASKRIFTLANGSRIWVSGIENKKQANKIRGRIRRTALVCIDEAQDWPTELLRYTYQVVIWPTLADVGGRTILGGTGTAPRGFWFEHTRKPEVSVHRWTMFENTRGVSDAAAVLTKAIADKGIEVIDLTHIIETGAVDLDSEIAQEYFCRFVAGQKQIFHLTRAKNTYDPAKLPGGTWYYVIGIDPGTVDKFAIVVWGWTDASPKLYLRAYEAVSGLGTGEAIAMVMRYVEKFPPVALVSDPATGGAAYVIDLQDRFGLPAEAAEKDGKVSAVLTMRDAIRRGEVLIPEAELPEDETQPQGEFARTLQTPEWDVTQVQKSLKGHMPDLVDAALYGYRKARPFDYVPPATPETEEERVRRRLYEVSAERQRAVDEILGVFNAA